MGSRLRALKDTLAILGVVGFLAGGSMLMGYLGEYARKRWNPKSVYSAPTGDLNSDGVPDMILERNNGYRTPFFGIESEDGTIYVTDEEMRRLRPDSDTDFDSIREELNKRE